jgi:glycolate oxidase FAD binding subunit
VRFQSRVERAVAEQIATLRALLGSLADEANVLHGLEEANFWQALDTPKERDTQVNWLDVRAALAPSAVAEWLAALRLAATEHTLALHWRAHAGHGSVRTRLSGQPDALVAATQTMRAAAEGARGALVVEEYAPTLARRIDPWGEPAALDLMRRIKAQFDPHNTLNPGRFVGGI